MKENQASSTAFMVLQGLLYIAQSTEHAGLVADDIVTIGKQILEASKEGKKRLRQLHNPLLPWVVGLKEYLFLPGITLHYVLRKNYIEDMTRQAIADGVTQVINLGAGFDTLAWRLKDRHPQVNFIEIDHPDTNRLKTLALAVPGTPTTELVNMHFLSVDFTEQNLDSALREFSYFDSDRPTLFICEGVLMYLEIAAISELFNAINQLTGEGSLLLFTSVEPQGSKANNTRALLYRYLDFIGEPIKWSLDSEKLPAFLHQQHCHLQARADTHELKRRYLKSDTTTTLHHGEYLVMARFGTPGFV